MAEYLAIRQGRVTEPADSESLLTQALEAWEQRLSGAVPTFEITLQPDDGEIGDMTPIHIKLGMISVGFLSNGARVIRGRTQPTDENPASVPSSVRIETNLDPTEPATASVTVRPTFDDDPAETDEQ